MSSASHIREAEGMYSFSDSSPLGIFARRIPWREEPGGLQSVGSQRVGHD